MRVRNSGGILLASFLSAVSVQAHRYAYNPHLVHKRATDTCACVVRTTTTWVPFDESEWTTPSSTMTTTVFQTAWVLVEEDATTTITTTVTDDAKAAPTPTASATNLKKRGDIADFVYAKIAEESASCDKTTSTVFANIAAASKCSCYETVISTWVPYKPNQFVLSPPGNGTSFNSTTPASTTASQTSTTSHSSSSSSHTSSSSSSSSSSSTTSSSSSAPLAAAAAVKTPPPPPPPPTTSAPPPPPATTSTPPAPVAFAANVVNPPPSGLYGITYTPYDQGGGCKSAGAVLVDLQSIKAKGFPRIRMYSTDCGQLQTVADQAISLGLQLTMGIFIDGSGLSRGYSELDQLIAWGKWGSVDVINIGNEAVFSGKVGAGDMVNFIGTCKGKLRAAGYGGIISTVETVGTFQQYPALCQSLESVVHANIHPYFNPGTSSANAGSFVVSQRGILASLCGKSVIVSECGWPSGGGSNGAAIASFFDQQTAIASIKAATGNTGITWFSFSNDNWKPAGVEQFFGTLPFMLW